MIINHNYLYNCNFIFVSGGMSKINKDAKRKKPFDTLVLGELYNAVEYIFEKELKTDLKESREKDKSFNKEKMKKKMVSEINKVINNKLSKINVYFANLRKDVPDKNLPDDEKREFKNYAKYVEDLELFDNLDENESTCSDESEEANLNLVNKFVKYNSKRKYQDESSENEDETDEENFDEEKTESEDE